MENLQANPQQNAPDDTPDVVDEHAKTLNAGSSSSPSSDTLKKRTRDHTQMCELQNPENTDLETAEQTEFEQALKIPKLNGAEEETETKDEDEGGGRGATHHPKLKRRKIALLVAYCGVGYQGMQRNPGAKTIEGELEEALFKAGAISPEFFGNPKLLDWMRSARTDKGVSAVGQVVSGRFFIDPPGFVERVNSHLPDQIRVLGYKRVTPSFSAKKFCDRRKYEYVLPVFALDPSAHRDRESVLASVGLVKCVECSERGRKVVGVMGKKNEFGKGGVNGLENNDELNMEADNAELNEIPSENQDLIVAGNENIDDSKDKQNDEIAVKSSFSYGEEERGRFNRILRKYVGTHNFHNLTTRTKAEDPAANRYILSFEASDVFNIDGMDFVRCIVLGQSFMLHQIRKMMGLAVAVMRGCAPESIIDTALRKDVHMNVPTAPELGLFLDECFFPAYNQKWQATHEEVSLKGFEKEILEFKQKYIYKHMASTEVKDGVVALWLHSLNHRNYPDFVAGKETEKPQTEIESTISVPQESIADKDVLAN